MAFILRDGEQGPDVLFILRAQNDNDPWSGNIGFPGGRMDQRDRTPRETAERETREEVGLDLRDADHLGRLDDIVGAHLPVHVSCFVYAVATHPPLTLSHEVSRAFWFPLAALADPRRHREAEVEFRGELFLRPAIDVVGRDGPLLWGITYRLVTQMLTLHEPSFPALPED